MKNCFKDWNQSKDETMIDGQVEFSLSMFFFWPGIQPGRS